MEDFTPISGLVGGLLLGSATALLLWLNGRLAGISGIVGGLLTPKSGDAGWRVVFVIGILLGVFAWTLLAGGGDLVQIETSLPVLGVAGLLVGFGTRLGSGCTSGHGLCGLSRFSRRSITATLVFFGVAMLTVFLVRHVL
ncbi:MAG: YeeE/YedE family protein [Rubrobacter sp.]|jgi:uncharacterized membrane protein YedE/YeeE|nr:YeeE/YedE family protein [Rubrobacter sp.]